MKLTHLPFIEVYSLGQIGAGKVVEFVPKEKKHWMPLPKHARYFDQFVEFDVSGNSLSGIGITDGMILTCRRNFELSEIKNRVCIVYFHVTGEMSAKMVRPNDDGTVSIISADPDLSENTYFADEVEILALAIEKREAI